MIKILQEKLFKCGYITNSLIDKPARFEIHEFIKECLETNSKQNVITAIDIFISNFLNRKGSNIQNKAAYFKKIITNTLSDFDVPDIEFTAPPISNKEISEMIFNIIEIATTQTSKFQATNPLNNPEWNSNPFMEFSDDLYDRAIMIMKRHKDYYTPLIERLLKLNHIPNEGPSIKPDMDDIYEKIGKGIEKHVY